MENNRKMGIITIVFGGISIAMAWWGLVAIAGLVCGILAIVFGIKSKKMPQDRVGGILTKIGFILGIVGAAVSVVFIIVGIVGLIAVASYTTQLDAYGSALSEFSDAIG